MPSSIVLSVLGRIGYAALAFFAVGWLIGVRAHRSAGLNVILGSLLFTLAAILLPLLHISFLHAWWIIPAALVFSVLAIFLPAVPVVGPLLWLVGAAYAAILRTPMLGWFKSPTARRRERWIRFNAELIRSRMQDVYDVLSQGGAIPVRKHIEDRINSDFFAGYLMGFADILVTEFSDDEPTRARYSRLFFDCVLTNRGGDWAWNRARQWIEGQQSEFADGFPAGREDARDCIATNQPKLTRLGDFFIREKCLAA